MCKNRQGCANDAAQQLTLIEMDGGKASVPEPPKDCTTKPVDEDREPRLPGIDWLFKGWEKNPTT